MQQKCVVHKVVHKNWTVHSVKWICENLLLTFHNVKNITVYYYNILLFQFTAV